MVVLCKSIVIGVGILLLLMAFYAYAMKKMTELIGILWGVIGIVMILLGSIPAWSAWTQEIKKLHAFPLLCFGILLLFFVFGMSVHISLLIHKNQELAMQVSLLNQENEQILHKIEEKNDEKKDPVCH